MAEGATTSAPAEQKSAAGTSGSVAPSTAPRTTSAHAPAVKRKPISSLYLPISCVVVGLIAYTQYSAIILEEQFKDWDPTPTNQPANQVTILYCQG